MERKWNRQKRVLGLFTSLVLIIGLFPSSSYAAEDDATGVTTTPIRDQEYYQTTFPAEALEENAGDAAHVYTSAYAGYADQQLTISTVPGVADEEIVGMISPVGGRIIIITGNMDRGLYFSISIPESLPIEDAIETLKGDARVTSVERRGFFAIDDPVTIDDSVIGNEFARLGGSTRYDTMQLVAQYGRTSADTAIVVSGSDSNWPDALSASGLAGLYDAPVLTTTPASLSSQTQQTLVSLGVTRVLIVGGTGAVTPAVAVAINAIPTVTSVTRIAGSDRYATSEAVYRFAESDGESWVNPTGYTSSDYITTPTWKNAGGKKMAILATGLNYPDALSASALSSYGHYPILLTNGSSLTAGTQDILNTGEFDEILVAGGTGAVSKAVRTAAADLVDPQDVRGHDTGANWWWSASGSDRYETSFLLSSRAKREGIALDNAIIASGVSSADAIVSSALKSPILLVAQYNSLQARSFVYYNAYDIDTIIAVGGTAAVSDTVAEGCIINWHRMRDGDPFYGIDGAAVAGLGAA